jgi:hypothetical protein
MKNIGGRKRRKRRSFRRIRGRRNEQYGKK